MACRSTARYNFVFHTPTANKSTELFCGKNNVFVIIKLVEQKILPFGVQPLKNTVGIVNLLMPEFCKNE